MKHLLNNLSSDEKNRIREQYEGGMSIDNSKFKKLIETKLGDAKPLISEEVSVPPKDLNYDTWAQSVKKRMVKSEIKYIDENKTWPFSELRLGGRRLGGYIALDPWTFLPDPKFEILNFNKEGVETIKMLSAEGGKYEEDVVVEFEIKRDGVGILTFFVVFEGGKIMSPEDKEYINKKGGF